MKTIRQIADEIGVSKQAVYKRYKGKLHTVCAPYAHTEQGVLYLSEQAETLIKQDFLKADRSNSWPADAYYANFTCGSANMKGLTSCRVASTQHELDI